MRAADEIRWTLPGLKDRAARDFALRRLGDLAVSPETEGLLALCRPLATGDSGAAAELAAARLEPRLTWARAEQRGRAVVADERAPGADDAPPELGEEGRVLAGEAAAEFAALVPRLAEWARSPGALGRDAAVALGALGSPAALDALRAAGPAAPPARRLRALAAFRGEGAAALASEILATVPAAERAGLLSFYAALPGGPPADLRAEARAGDAVARAALAHALEGAEPGDAEDELATLLGDADPWVRAHAAESLGARAPRGLEARLLPAFEAEELPGVQAAILRAAARAGLGSIELVVRGFRSKAGATRAAAWRAWEAAGLSREVVAPHLDGALSDPDPAVRAAAAGAVAALEPDRAADCAETLVAGREAAELLAGIDLLPVLEDPAAGDVLGAIYRGGKEAELKAAALRALGRRAARFPEAAQALVPLLADPAGRVPAARYLAGAHPAARPEALLEVGKALDREDDDAAAVGLLEALGLGGPLPDPLPKLLRNLSDAGGDLAWAAAAALARAGDEAAGRRHRVLETYGAWLRGEAGGGDLAAYLESAGASERGPVARVVRWAAEGLAFLGGTPQQRGLVRRLRLKDALREGLPGAAVPANREAPPRWLPRRSPLARPTRGRRAMSPARPGRRIRRRLKSPPPIGDRIRREAFAAARRAAPSLRLEAPAPPGPPAAGWRYVLGGVAAVALVAGAFRGSGGPAVPPAGPGGTTAAPPAVPRLAPRLSPRGGGDADDPEATARAAEAIAGMAVRSAVAPTHSCEVFEKRWMRFRRWLTGELGRGEAFCTYSEWLALRARHLRGDESAHGRLDDYLRRAGLFIEARAEGGGAPGGRGP